MQALGFTPAVTFFSDCPNEASINALFDQLSDQWSVLMPPAQYSFAMRFAWLSDRFGVSSQRSVALG